uniref:Membrane spanning 4-domains A5 n=1 Tax=Monodelphis domestica TaxID=13616 RepID=F7G7C2_MONDO
MPNYKEGTKMQKEPLFEEKLIISAIPYKRQGFVPSLLKGEPKMLGVLQILMGLIIASFGGFLFFSFIEVKSTNSKTPILYITAYPLWAGACYTMSGFITILNTLYPPRQNHQLLFLDSLCILVAASGIALLLYSFYEDAFFHCDNLSNGICTIGKSFLHGIFSLLLILTLVQLSIAATLLAFECQGIRKDTAKEAIQVLFGLMNFCFGAVFIFTHVSPYPRFPFIFITGYPFWGSAFFINSGSLLIAFERRTTKLLGQISLVANTFSSVVAIAGIVLLSFSLVLDNHYLCGYVGGGDLCEGITVILTGILGMMMVFAVLELLISLSYSMFRHNLTCAESENWFSIEV